MSNIDKQALVIPQRERHDWSQAVMRNCDFCQQWALTVRHSDGGCICASCCDSEYTTALSSALVVALDELEAKYRLNAEQADIIAKQEKWIKDVEATMIVATDRAEAAEKRIAELEAKLETADKLQDSAFRHGLQHGFSLGQTDNQAGFVECLSAYGTGKGE